MEINNTTKFKRYNNSLQDINMGLDIDNTHSIMTLLRNSIYSNPLESFVRELWSNAVDAHLKNDIDTPIKISLQLTKDKSGYDFILRDFGSSMTIEDIETVYSKMGKSTKNISNTEMGKWGLGAKSALAYTNQFFIDTFTKEDNEYFHRSWVQYIDSSRVGKISLLEEKSFTGKTGTQIRVPIQLKDYSNIITHINTYLSYSILPFKVEGFEFEDLKPSPNFLGEDWSIHLFNDRYYYSDTTFDPSTIVIAGIPYRINKKALEDKFATTNYNSVVKHLLKENGISTNFDLFKNFLYASRYFEYALRAPIGSVDLNASREDLQYTEKTCCYLYLHLFRMFQEYCVHLNIDYVKNPSYLNACYKYSNQAKEVIKTNLLNNMVWEQEGLSFSSRPPLFKFVHNNHLKKYEITVQGDKWKNTEKEVLSSCSVNRISVNQQISKLIFVIQDTEYINYSKFLKDYILRVRNKEYVIYVINPGQINDLCDWVLKSSEVLQLSNIVFNYKTFISSNKTTVNKKKDASVFNAYIYKGSSCRSKALKYARFFNKDKAPCNPKEPNYYVSNNEFEALEKHGITLPDLDYWTEFPNSLNNYLSKKGILKSQVWFTPRPSKHFVNNNWNSLANLIKQDFNNINTQALIAYCDVVYTSKKISTMAPFFLTLDQGPLSDNCLFSRLKKQYFEYKEKSKIKPSFTEIAYLCYPAFKELVECDDTSLYRGREERLLSSGLISLDKSLVKYYQDFLEDYPLLRVIGYHECFKEHRLKSNFRDYIYARSLVLKDDNKKITLDV